MSALAYLDQGKKDIEDLLIQATQERSHFYTASVLRNTLHLIDAFEDEVERLRGALEATYLCIDDLCTRPGTCMIARPRIDPAKKRAQT